MGIEPAQRIGVLKLDFIPFEQQGESFLSNLVEDAQGTTRNLVWWVGRGSAKRSLSEVYNALSYQSGIFSGFPEQ